MKPVRTITLTAVLLFMTGFVCAETPAQAQPVKLDIASQPLGDALNQFAQQTGLQLVYHSRVAKGLQSPRVVGTVSPQAALNQLLDNTGLRYEYLDADTVAIFASEKPRAASQERVLRLAQSGDVPAASQESGPPSAAAENTGAAIPEILVRNSRILNMDIPRSRDDVQPYIIFDRAAIERSGALNIEAFLRDRLPMNTIAASAGQLPGEVSAGSMINLRGLSARETLVLIDGHRSVSPNIQGDAGQPDVNSIPLAAVERIEVLPATASGIYGGSATGGVVNVILRRDYSGVEMALTYGGTFDGGGTTRRVDFSGGFSLEGGRTNILLMGGYSDGDTLFAQDRDFLQRGRAHILANDSATILNAFFPPLGATTNIQGIDFNTFSPTNLTLKDGTPLNSPIAFIPAGYAGWDIDDGVALLDTAGRYNLALANTAQRDGGGRQGLLSIPSIESAAITLRRQFAPRVQAFLDLGASNTFSRQPSNELSGVFFVFAGAANNPFSQDILVNTPLLDTGGAYTSTLRNRRAVGGVIVKLGAGWQLEADYTWNRSRFFNTSPVSSLDPDAGAAVSSGALDILRDTNAYPVSFAPYVSPARNIGPGYTTLKDAAMRASGPLPWSLPGGEPTLAGLIEYRKESVGDFPSVSGAGNPRVSFGDDQSVRSVYLESRVPVFSAKNGIAGIHLLELQLAVRRDEYGSTARNASDSPTFVRVQNDLSSVDPTFGFRYQPVPAFTVRASYGTGFLPPSLNQFAPAGTFSLPLGARGRTDPLRGDEPLGLYSGGLVSVDTGGNPGLLPEQSESWSAGVIFTPPSVPGLRVSVDWTKIDKTNNVNTLVPTAIQEDLDTLIEFAPERITRGENQPGDEAGWPGPITAIDQRSINIARARVDAYDVGLSYDVDTASSGTFGFSAVGTRTMSNQTQLTPAADVIERAGMAGLSKWKANSTLTWTYKQASLAWTARFYSSYWLTFTHQVIASQGSATVPSQVYHDLYAGYRFEKWDNTELKLTVENLFNRMPPVQVTDTSSYLYSTLGDPSLARYAIGIGRSF